MDTGHVPPILIARLAREGQQPDPNHTFNRFRLDPPGAPFSAPNPASASPPPAQETSSQSPSTSSPEPKRKRNLHVRQKGEPAACKRCRRLKKKCSRTGPECVQCMGVGLPCSFSNPPETLGTAAERYDNPKEPPSGNAWGPGYGNGVRQPVTNSPGVVRNGMAPAITMGTDQSDSMDTSGYGDSLEPREVSRQLTGQLGSPTSHRRNSSGNVARQNRQRLPEDAAGRAFVNAFFKHIHRAYPFMDKAKILEDIDTMGDSNTWGIEHISTNLYMVMALGCYTLRRAGQVSDAISSKFQISQQGMLQIMQKSLTKPKDIESVQTLLLLGLYCLFDPTGLSPYMITALLASQALSLGLSRKALPEQGLSLVEIEMRHRLFWSIYTLDRMVAVSCGLPFNLHDENVNVPLPGLTMEEFSSSEKGHFALVLQVHRQVVSLRQLEEKIMQKAYLCNTGTIGLMSRAQRHATMEELRSQVDEWYRTGCLLTPMEQSDQIPFHNTIPWLNHRYQNLMLLLYSPSNLNHQISADHFGELERSLQKYIQLSAVLIQKRHLPLNWVTLCRFVAICPLLLYCLMRRQYENAISVLQDQSATCAEVLDAFPERWHIAKRAALVYRNMTLLPLLELNKEIACLVKDMLGDCSMYKRAVEASAQLLHQRSEVQIPHQGGPNLMMGPEFNLREEELWAGIGEFGMEFM